MSPKILLLTTLIATVAMASSAITPEATSTNRGLFAADLFNQISKTRTDENVIISPVSIQTAMAMAYIGAEGDTSKELEKGLRLSSSDKEEVGKSFAEILKPKKGSAQLSIANRLFVNSGYKLRSTYNDLATKYFNSEAETVNFSKSSEAIDTINTWVEQNTNNKITKIMEPGSVNGETSAIIANAIYFKGEWQEPFSKDSTRKRPFWVTPSKSVDVDTMYGGAYFNYAELSELDATAIEMPYKDSDLSMIVILPNERDGLAKLEEKLSSLAINELSSKLKREEVTVFMPKFKIDFGSKLVNVLRSLGISSLFENANLSGIFESGPAVKVSDVIHKAFIEVNEAGSEAAATTILKIVPVSLNSNEKYFTVDHPFVFAIKGTEAVYFVGHIVTF